MQVLNSLNSVIMCAINSMDAGDTKKEAVQSITSFVEENYMGKATFEDFGSLPIEAASALNEKYGMEFKVNDGKVSGVRFGGGRSDSDYALVG